MTDRSSVDEPSTTDESTQTTSGTRQDHPTTFTPERAPRRRVHYERRVDADGWIDPAAEPTRRESPATAGDSRLADCRDGERDD
ncbi:hypothetical protein [Halorubrum halophilum]|uniref:hypothetical protein n=1 Tax=Halorubrum halophilum TaxID=413816 RepID=UPI0012ABF343|nr:hypothetical protein [Halorubrum halophilum]